MGVSRHLGSLGARDVGIDIGTANTVVYVRGRGVVSSGPSVVDGARPLRNGSIADLDAARSLLAGTLAGVIGGEFAHPRVGLSLPAGVSDAERQHLVTVCREAGAREVRSVAQPFAAALGAGLDLSGPEPVAVAVIGAGTTEVAVFSGGEMAVSRGIGVAGDELDRAIARHCRSEHGLMIDQPTAEEVKLEAATAFPPQGLVQLEVSGSEVGTGAPASVILGSGEVAEAIAEPVERVVGAVTETLDRAPRDLADAMIGAGITLAGGTSALQGLKQRLADACRMPIGLAESPITCVAVGSGIALDELQASRRAAP